MLRAFYEWIVDNGLTPYVVVSTDWPSVDVPTQYVKDGQIVLNISPSACVNFSMDVEAISFQARFGGQPMQVYFPCEAVGAIYARENGAGTVFTQTPPEPSPDGPKTESSDVSDEVPSNPSKPAKRATLRVVK